MVKKWFGWAFVCMACVGSAHALTLSSPAFEDGGRIADRFTFSMSGQCSGANQSPPLVFSQVPAGTRSLAVTVIDPDGGNWLHWKVWNISPEVTALGVNAAATQALSQGRNSFGVNGYGGPCPPTPDHRYVFTLYALGQTFASEPSLDQLRSAALATATLTGLRSPSDRLAWIEPNRQLCLFNWAERQFPDVLAPRGTQDMQVQGLVYRYYHQTQSYLGILDEDQHLYFLSTPTGLLDLGAVRDWAALAACS